MADIKLFVVCVTMVVVCLELQQDHAQGDVYTVNHGISFMARNKLAIKLPFQFDAKCSWMICGVSLHDCVLVCAVLSSKIQWLYKCILC